ncbi:MAG: hypothetical protein DRP78_05350 [Candidatus Omnitrophota bacterium]|nr:MAG: hypothetical protein DRP78_05350 [Candidatus Omnitrophota bacterium]
MNKHLFIQRRFYAQKEKETGYVHFVGSIYIAYYFYVDNQLKVAKYAFSIKYSKTEEELKQLG